MFAGRSCLANLCLRLYLFIHTYICTYIYIHIYTYIYVCMYTKICVCMYAGCCCLATSCSGFKVKGQGLGGKV